MCASIGECAQIYANHLSVCLSVCLSLQVAPETHWPELEALILVVSDHKKPISSTEGMRRTVETSELLKVRAHSTASLDVELE